jgi:hypothetical protein
VRREVQQPAKASECGGDAFSEDYARSVISTLAQDAWAGRKYDSNGLRAATQWLEQQFACMGLKPGAPALGLSTDGFAQAFSAQGDDLDDNDDAFEPDRAYPLTNVVGSIEGRGALADEVVVVGAHLDHLGKRGSAVVPGANDDASGILALLAIAKHLLPSAPRDSQRTVVFVGWGVEEYPFYLRGSAAFFKGVPAAKQARIVYYVNFDMIGSYAQESTVHVLGTYPGSPALKMMKAIAPTVPALEIGLGGRGESSDHVTFCEHGIPYAFFWTSDTCYHKPCDRADHIDYAHLPDILRSAAALVQALAVEPGLMEARKAFPAAFAKAWPDKECESED